MVSTDDALQLATVPSTYDTFSNHKETQQNDEGLGAVHKLRLINLKTQRTNNNEDLQPHLVSYTV